MQITLIVSIWFIAISAARQLVRVMPMWILWFVYWSKLSKVITCQCMQWSLVYVEVYVHQGTSWEKVLTKRGLPLISPKKKWRDSKSIGRSSDERYNLWITTNYYSRMLWKPWENNAKDFLLALKKWGCFRMYRNLLLLVHLVWIEIWGVCKWEYSSGRISCEWLKMNGLFNMNRKSW